MNRSWKLTVAALALCFCAGHASQGCSHQARGPDNAAAEGMRPAAGSAAPQSTTTPAQKSASDATKRANADQLRRAPFSDARDFANAKRGLIAPLPNDGVIRDSKGKVVWNLKALRDYVKQGEQAPETVNPSLWRMAQLLTINGLFEVVPGVYQVRGADLSNMTIVEGRRGITIYDPLISTETAKAALDLYYAHRPRKPVVAVVYSHSHVDHFGGVRGVVDEKDVAAGRVRIYAPDGFIEEAVAENVFAGTAMSRRASYMYGNLVPPSPTGQTTAGLGASTSSGTVSLIPPTDLIKNTGDRRTIDGLQYEFVMAPGSEAPAEMMWFVQEKKLVNTAENSTHTMHNLYTLRGAKTRDAAKWPGYLNELLKLYGKNVEVEIGMHHWPTWGNTDVVEHIKAQRDIYKFMHDQTLHFANQGHTLNEVADLVKIPDELQRNWAVHGYYGSQSHNVRAVYNYYLGYFDGNPAHLDPLPPEQVARRYVDAMGGREGVISSARQALASGDYRWGAEIMNHLVFASPNDQEAKNLQADILEQLGYQAENATWRNFYLSGAEELRKGVAKDATPSTVSADVIASTPLDLVFGYMGIQLNAKRAAGKKITVNWNLPDTKQRYALFLERSVLNAWPDYQDDKADVTVTLDRPTLNQILTKQLDLKRAIQDGDVRVNGSTQKLEELMSYLDDLGNAFWFNIVTP